MSEEMMFFGKYFLLILNGYLIGSILFGYLVTKLIKHVDTIKEVMIILQVLLMPSN